MAKGFNFCQLSGVAESLRFELPKHVIAKRVLTTCVAKNYQRKIHIQRVKKVQKVDEQNFQPACLLEKSNIS